MPTLCGFSFTEQVGLCVPVCFIWCYITPDDRHVYSDGVRILHVPYGKEQGGEQGGQEIRTGCLLHEWVA